jgi:7-cyano-7-deazaguanine synthase in queuosine biosynthesis
MEEVNVLLYSGGIDSLCSKEILERRGLELLPLRFNFKTPYNEHEQRAVEAYNSLGRGAKIIEVDFSLLDNSGFSDFHIPARNAVLILGAVAYVYNKYGFNPKKRLNIYFPQILEFGRDKNEIFWLTMNWILRHSYGYNVRIKRPFSRWTKWRLIKESGLDRDFLMKYSWSCYFPNNDEPCYRCSGCLMREYSFRKLGWEYRYVKYMPHIAGGNPLVYVLDLDKALYWAYLLLIWRLGLWKK